MSKNTPTPTPNEHAQAYQLMAQIGRSTVAVIDAIVQRGGFRGEELSIQAISMSEAFEAKEGTS